MDKINELKKMTDSYSESENIKIDLDVQEKFRIKKNKNSFKISLDKKDVEKMSLDALKWGLQGHLSLIKNGRFPSLKKQFIFLTFPLIIYIISYALIMLLSLSDPDSISTNAMGLTFFISYIGMCAWSRKKILDSDESASQKVGKEFGIEFLSFYMEKEKEADFFIRDKSVFYVFYLFSSYPSFFQRMRKLSK